MRGADEQDYVRIACMYYMGGATQADIAKKMGLSRLRVNRMLAEARESGLVRIQISSRLQSCVALERQIESDFNLKDVIIIPTPDDQSLIPMNLGRIAGEYLARYLHDNEVRELGVGWGETTLHTIRGLPETSYPKLRVNSLMGSLTQGLEVNTFEIARELAQRLHARCSYLVAPIYANSVRSRDAILEQEVPLFAGKGIALDAALLGLGELSPRTLICRYGVPKDIPLQELHDLGAVGEVLGQFFTQDGVLIKHSINERAIAFKFDDLRKIRTTIFVGGGRHKIEAIGGVLAAGVASVLICDEDTARAAAALAKRPAAPTSVRRGEAVGADDLTD